MKGFAYREGADPTLVRFNDTYFLFASMSAGFWHSKDLVNWTFKENLDLLINDYAPDARQIGEYLYFSASKISEKCPILRTKDPLSEDFEVISEELNFYDPNLFADDDSRVYLYWGCNNNKPLYGIELDPNTLSPKGKKAELLYAKTDEHGYERLSQKNDEKKSISSGKTTNGTFIEGAYVNKINNKYYLQFASPSTSVNTYNDSVYVSDNPLGPYIPQEHRLFSSKPGGFITGAGHGSTIQDEYGNWWHASTMVVAVNKNFERRIGIFPAGIDNDGILFCNQSFSDYPVIMPVEKVDPMSIVPEWMLLSYKKKATASSSISGYGPDNGVDENIRTRWVSEPSNKPGWYTVDLGNSYEVHAIQVNLSDFEVPILKRKEEDYGGSIYDKRYIDIEKLHSRYLIEGSLDGEEWFVIEDKTDDVSDLPHDYFEYVDGIQVRFVKVTAVELPYESTFSISGLRVFGKGKEAKPSATTKVSAKRQGPMDALIEWESVKEAQGYNVRYGIAPDKLYSSWLIYGENKLELTTLCKGKEYFIAVDSFNENGITEGKVAKLPDEK